MSSNPDRTEEIPVTLETATNWARSGLEWDKVYPYIFLHPQDFFTILPQRRWPIAFQVVYNGNLDLLKRILALFTDDQINIRFKANDNKTILDVAREVQVKHPTMITYVEHLFAQDELIKAAKDSNWRSVRELLDNNSQLANEKPPYSPYFLLHYVVQNGDAHILEDLLRNFQFQTNLLSNNNETALELATKLNKSDMCSVIRSKTTPGPPISHIHHRPPPPPPPSQPLPRSSNRPACQPLQKIPQEPMSSQIRPQILSPPPQQTCSPTNPSSCLGFGNIVRTMSPNGISPDGQSTLFNSTRGQPRQPSQPQYQQQAQATRFPYVNTKKTIVSEVPVTHFDPPLPPSRPPPMSTISDEQVMTNMRCTLTNEIFVDPVIASDGKTYERSAISDWINSFHCSPSTGEPMDLTFRDNTEIKQIVQSMQKNIKK